MRNLEYNGATAVAQMEYIHDGSNLRVFDKEGAFIGNVDVQSDDEGDEFVMINESNVMLSDMTEREGSGIEEDDDDAEFDEDFDDEFEDDEDFDDDIEEEEEDDEDDLENGIDDDDE